MIQIMTAELLSRETMKTRLEEEVNLVNSELENARNSSDVSIYIDRELSDATEYLLRKAGYDVTGETHISWCDKFEEISSSPEEIDRMAEELNIKIINCENPNNTIDPNWTPKKE